jgi:hypothetical protein
MDPQNRACRKIINSSEISTFAPNWFFFDGSKFLIAVMFFLQGPRYEFLIALIALIARIASNKKLAS